MGQEYGNMLERTERGLQDSEYEMNCGEKTNFEHHPRRDRLLDYSVAHRDQQEQEETDAVSRRVEYNDENQQPSSDAFISSRVEISVVRGDGEHFDDEEDDCGGDVVLNGEDVGSILEAQEEPSESEPEIDDSQSFVELREHSQSATEYDSEVSRRLTRILGYSAAGRCPTKTFLKSTTPVY